MCVRSVGESRGNFRRTLGFATSARASRLYWRSIRGRLLATSGHCFRLHNDHHARRRPALRAIGNLQMGDMSVGGLKSLVATLRGQQDALTERWMKLVFGDQEVE